MNTKNKSLSTGIKIAQFLGNPDVSARDRLFLCKVCKEFKEHKAKGMCRECYQKKWKLENPEKVKAEKRKYRAEHKEETAEYNKKYQAENPGYWEKYRIENKDKLKARNPEKSREYRRKWTKKNPGYGKKWRDENPGYGKKWRDENPGKMREKYLKRRDCGSAKKGVIDSVITENILKYGIITCEQCKESCEDNYHIDHIIPISRGGSSDYDNLQILCAKHNMEKHVDIVDYRQDAENNQMFLKI